MADGASSSKKIFIDTEFRKPRGLAAIEADMRRLSNAAKEGQTFSDPTTGMKASVESLTRAIGQLDAMGRRADATLAKLQTRAAERGNTGAFDRINQQRENLARERQELMAATRDARRPAPGARPLNPAVVYRRTEEARARRTERETDRVALRENFLAVQQRRAEEQAQLVATRRQQRALQAQSREAQMVQRATQKALPAAPSLLELPAGPNAIPLGSRELRNARAAAAAEQRRIRQEARAALPAGPPAPLALPAGPQAIAITSRERNRANAEAAAARDVQRRQLNEFQEAQRRAEADIGKYREGQRWAREGEARGGGGGKGGGKVPPTPGPADDEPPRSRRKLRGGEGESAEDARAAAAEKETRAERERRQVGESRDYLRQITPDDRAAKASLAVEERMSVVQQRLAEVTAQRSAAGQASYRAEIQLETETAALRAARTRMRSADGELIRATAEEANARQEHAARMAIARTGEDSSQLEGVALLARASVVQRTEANRRASAVTEQTTRGDIEAAAERKLAEAKLRVAIRNREREMFTEARKSGAPLMVGDVELPKANRFQRMQSALHPASDKLPQEELTGKQYFGDKLQRTVGFAASGILLGGTIAAISEMVKDASELEVTFVRLRGQMEGIGQSNAFPQVREQIREIAATTGQASNEVAGFLARMIGLTHDPAAAVRDTAAAMKLATVTGADMATLTTSLVPIQKAFGVTTEEVGDKVVEMGEKFGIAEDDVLQFLGKTAAVAKSAGLTFDEVAAIGGNMANSLGKPIDASAEYLNKSQALLAANKDKVFAILQGNPDTVGAIEPMIQDFAEGKTGKAFLELLKVSEKLTAQQKSALLTSLGSRREAEEFNAALQNAPAILNDIAVSQENSGKSTGKLNERFADLKQTVLVTGQTIKATFQSLGEAIFRSGVSGILVDVGNALTIVIGAAGGMFSIFAKLNEVLSPWGIPILGTLTKMAGTAFVLTKAWNLFAKSAIAAKTATDGVKAATDGDTASTTRSSGAKVENAGATRTQTAAEEDLARTRAATRSTGAVGGFPYNVSGASDAAAAGGAGGAGVAAANAMSAAEIAAARARLHAEELRRLPLALPRGGPFEQPTGPPLPLPLGPAPIRRAITEEIPYVASRRRPPGGRPDLPLGFPALPPASSPWSYEQGSTGRWRDPATGRYVSADAAARRALQPYPFPELEAGRQRVGFKHAAGPGLDPIPLSRVPLPRISTEEARALRGAWLEPLKKIAPLRQDEFRRLLASGDPILSPRLALPRGRDFNAIQTRLGTGAPLPLEAGSPLLADARRRIPSAEYTPITSVEPIRPAEFRALQAAREQGARDALFGQSRLALPAGQSRAFQLPAGPSPITGTSVDQNIFRAARTANAEANLAAAGAPLALGMGRGAGALVPFGGLGAALTGQARRQGRLFESFAGSGQAVAPAYAGKLAIAEGAILTGPGGRAPTFSLGAGAAPLLALGRGAGAGAGDAAGAAAAGASAWARFKSRLTAPTAGYGARSRQWEESLAARAAAGEQIKAGWGARALSGGTGRFKSAWADETSLASDTKQGWSGSPGVAAAIALAGAAAVKSAYDDQKTKINNEITSLQARTTRANADELKLIAGYHSDMWERAAAVVFGTPLAEDIGQKETLFRRSSPARRLLGGEYYKTAAEDPSATPIGQATQTSILEKQRAVTRQKATNLSDSNAQRIFDDLNTSRYGRDVAAAAGLDVTQIGELPTGTDETSGIWKFNAPSLYAAGMNWITEKKGGTIKGDRQKIADVMKVLADRKDPESSRMIEEYQKILDEGSTPDLNARAEEYANAGKFAEATALQGVDATVNKSKDVNDPSMRSMEELQADLDAGRISMQEFLREKNKTLKWVDLQAKEYKGTEAAEYKVLSAKTQTDTENAIQKSVSEFANLNSTLASYGSLTPKKAERDQFMALMSQSPTRIAIENLAPMLQQDMAAAEELYAAIPDPVARAAARKKGVPISAETRETYTQKLFNENAQVATGMQKVLTDAQAVGGFAGMSTDQFRDAVAGLSAREGISPEEAAMRLLNGEIDKYGILIDEARKAGDYETARGLSQERDKLIALRPQVEASFRDIPGLDAAPNELKQQAIDIEENAKKRNSQAKVLAAEYADNPILAAKIASDEADAQYLDMLKKRQIIIDPETGAAAATEEQVADAKAAKIDADKNQAKAAENLAKIKDNWSVILAKGDPMLELEAERDNLLKEQARLASKGDTADPGALVQNQQALFQNAENQKKAQLDIVRSGMSITEALASRSPLAAAQLALRRAEFEEQNAVGVAAKQQATAARIQAMQSLEDVVNQAFEARSGLLVAIANTNDDPVEAARLAAEEARRKWELAKTQTSDSRVLDPLEAASRTADRDLVRTAVQDQIDTIDFMQQMGQISMGQAITSLRAVLATVKVGSKEYESLSLKIRTMTQSAQADLQFNLPTTLGLPTLYEARRSRQSNAQGIGYQDNRNVVVAINVNGAQDPAAVAQQVSSALQSSLRGGNTFTSAIPVGA